MKWTKRVAAFAIAAVLAVSLAACGEGDTTGGQGSKPTTNTADITKMSAADVLAKVQTVQAEPKSMQADMNIRMSMSGGGENVDVGSKMVIAMQTDPMKMKMSIDVSGAGESQKTDLYLIQEGDKGAMYIQSGGMWMKEELDASLFEQATEQYSEQSSTDAYTKDAEIFENKGKKTINGKETILLQGKMTGKDMIDTLKQSGMDQQMEAYLKMAGMSLDTMSTKSGIVISEYIDQETMLPVRMEVDITDFMKELLDNIANGLDKNQAAQIKQIKINRFAMEMDMSWNEEVADITLPAEAAKAVETPGLADQMMQAA